jgi:hypothetical protein
MPTPPAISTRRVISLVGIGRTGGGYVKEPPTRMDRGVLRMESMGRWKYLAGGLEEFCTASSI